MTESILSERILLQTTSGISSSEYVAKLIINRPEFANAFDGHLLTQLTDKLQQLARDVDCRLLIIQAIGKHFSSGADLQWMRDTADLTYDENQKEALKLYEMYARLDTMPMPTLAIIKGSVYGGAVGIVAACDLAISTKAAIFCISETKIGLIPAVILPYLARKIPAVELNYLVLTASKFDGEKAKELNLLHSTVEPEALEEHCQAIINQLLSTSPHAQRAYKELQKQLDMKEEGGRITSAAIARIRASTAGKAGLEAFLNKSASAWRLTLPEQVSILT